MNRFKSANADWNNIVCKDVYMLHYQPQLIKQNHLKILFENVVSRKACYLTLFLKLLLL